MPNLEDKKSIIQPIFSLIICEKGIYDSCLWFCTVFLDYLGMIFLLFIFS